VTRVALLQPGAMGARIGGELAGAGHEVRWLRTGRSAATTERAAAEGLTASDDAIALVDGAAVVLSVLAAAVTGQADRLHSLSRRT
jgi:3-hydroxyisobutyrate dehydrogenase-like beta-hydroxyacid dehydrogenase